MNLPQRHSGDTMLTELRSTNSFAGSMQDVVWVSFVRLRKANGGYGYTDLVQSGNHWITL